jgi:hypothetical protein
VAAIDAKAVGGTDIREGKWFVIADSSRFDAFQQAQNRLVGLGAVGHEEIGVLGRAHVAVEDHAEATDHNVVEADGIGVGDDPGQVRTRELVLGHGLTSRMRRAETQPAERASDLVQVAAPASAPCSRRAAALPLGG